MLTNTPRISEVSSPTECKYLIVAYTMKTVHIRIAIYIQLLHSIKFKYLEMK